MAGCSASSNHGAGRRLGAAAGSGVRRAAAARRRARTRARRDRRRGHRRSGDRAAPARRRHRVDGLRVVGARRRPDAFGAQLLESGPAHRVVRRDGRFAPREHPRPRASLRSRRSSTRTRRGRRARATRAISTAATIPWPTRIGTSRRSIPSCRRSSRQVPRTRPTPTRRRRRAGWTR